MPPLNHGHPLTPTPALTGCDDYSANTGIGFANNYVPPSGSGQNSNHNPAVTPSPVTGRRRISNELWTLEDNENRTAHSMGPAAEQDTYVLDSIPSGILSSPEWTTEPGRIGQIFIDALPLANGFPWHVEVRFRAYLSMQCLLQTGLHGT